MNTSDKRAWLCKCIPRLYASRRNAGLINALAGNIEEVGSELDDRIVDELFDEIKEEIYRRANHER